MIYGTTGGSCWPELLSPQLITYLILANKLKNTFINAGCQIKIILKMVADDDRYYATTYICSTKLTRKQSYTSPTTSPPELDNN